jgi:hypothetical protein
VVALSWVLLTYVVEAILPPTHTREPVVKFRPLTVTRVPPASGPEVGEIESKSGDVLLVVVV